MVGSTLLSRFRRFSCRILSVSLLCVSGIVGAKADKADQRFPFRLLICGVAKNCAHSFVCVQQSAEELGARFFDYAVVIYENNSSDDTPQRLKQWSIKNPRVRIECEQLSEDQLKAAAELFNRRGEPCRYEQIARARNRMMKIAREVPGPGFDFVVMADLDIPDSWPVERLCEHIQRPDWDVITAFGMDEHAMYYDYFALRDAEWPLGPEFLGDYWFRNRRPQRARPQRGVGLIPVLSAFGGLALYRASAFLPFEFSAQASAEMQASARQWITNSEKGRQQVLAARGPQAALLARYADWRNPGVCCEHVPFFEALRQAGFQRCFLDSDMLLWRWGRPKDQ